MFSKIKAWFRSLIAKEVAKVSVSLTKERSEAIATLKNVEQEVLSSLNATIAAYESRIQTTLQSEHEAFVARLRATRQHISDGEPNVCRATSGQVAADHKLKLLK